MSNYLESDKVKVFPFGNERIHDPMSRTLNESNIARLIRFLTGNIDYVLNYDAEKHSVDFVLNGYTFTVDLTNNSVYQDEDASDIYASISVTPVDSSCYELLEGNDSGAFEDVTTGDSLAKKIPNGISYIIITSPTFFTYDFAQGGAATEVTITRQGLSGEMLDEEPLSYTSGPYIVVYPKNNGSESSPAYVPTIVKCDTGHTSTVTVNRFTGLSITATEPAASSCIHLLTKRNGEWTIPKFTYTYYESINCGTSTQLID